jgi:hypothetical protein
MSKKQFDDVPLFDVTPIAVEKQKPPKTVGSAICPGHPSISNKKTGVVRHNGHLHWREHRVMTWLGGSRVCSASLQALHDMPGKGHDDIECPCHRSMSGAA